MLQMASGSSATINGRRFTCGTVTLDSDTLSFNIEHGLGSEPEAVFVWCVGAPTKDDGGNNIQTAVGGVKYVSSGSSYAGSALLRTINGGYTTATASNYGMKKDSTYIYCVSYSTYYWKAGYTYQWLAIAEQGA